MICPLLSSPTQFDAEQQPRFVECQEKLCTFFWPDTQDCGFAYLLNTLQEIGQRIELLTRPGNT